jgi:hypothetical protein
MYIGLATYHKGDHMKHLVIFFLSAIIILLGLYGLHVKADSTSKTFTVVCKASTGFTCSEISKGCVKDAIYQTSYLVDFGKNEVIAVSSQNLMKDKEPKSDGTKYSFFSASTNHFTGEKTITAVGQVGTNATETIIIGEKSYVSSSVSSAGMRVFLMYGKCEGYLAK